MAGIGFELRKLFREQGLFNNIKAYAYSSLTTVGPMIISLLLIIGLQQIISTEDMTYLEWELYISTVAYCFIFSIVFTSGVSMVLTRYTADMLYEKKYSRLMSSYYGALIFILPIVSIIAMLFLSGVTAGWGYKLSAYFFFILLVIVWIQGIYLSALKDYVRIVRGFAIGAVLTLSCGWLASHYTDLEPTVAAMLSLDIGFLTIVILSGFHFEQRFPRADKAYYFEFLHYFKRYATLFFSGCFVYSGVYLHNFVYWLSPDSSIVADQYRTMPFYDTPVFYAFLSVIPTLVTFVVSVETSFYEKFRLYYLNIMNGGTIQDVMTAKKMMQKTLTKEISFLMEIQLLFTIVSIALGLKLLPKIGFTMAQLDLFIILALAYFLFIIFFVLMHILMYFDDRKGVFVISLLFVILNICFTYGTMRLEYDGLGMFIASFIALGLVIMRLLYVLRNIDYFTFCSQPINQHEMPRKSKSRFFKPGTTIAIMIVTVLLLSGCSELASNADEESDPLGVVNRAPMPDNIETKLIEDKRLYERDDDSSLKTLYITILPDMQVGRNLDWYSLNRMPKDQSGQKLDIIMQEGLSDGQGPRSGMFGYAATAVNATITIRGNTAWNTPQKSYRIKMTEEGGTYLDQRTLNLNKHSLDYSRIRNKLSFDLFEKIPDMTSLRTQFIHLYVKDLTTGVSSANYEDYGLYTHVEQPNKPFLRSHMLDPNGHLYKVAFFEYGRYEEQIKMEDDPTFDLTSFESILEIKGHKDHSKLIKMLEDVNDYSMPIDEVMAKHFDLDNFLTWTAANILMDNMDTDANNFYLYSPLNSDTWYILPWDYDGGWEKQRRSNSITPHQNGISNYWGSILHNRYFRKASHVELLKEKVEELYEKYINNETVEALISQYTDVTTPFLYRAPDVNYLAGQIENYQQELETIIQTPEAGMQRFIEDLEKPKPFYLDDVQQSGNQLRFSWGVSFDLQDDKLTYDFMLATDRTFQNVLQHVPDLTANSLELEKLPAGRYFWKVTVTDSKGNTQSAFDYVLDSDGEYYFGTKEFEVE
ncbi:exopolysaccharide Pel transporter PelG [Paenibacillus agaridevorans]|uniref:exopolysaccharide Pel transporter PelG n=1 Tax=Paenibacillus agaridevorans TaxID=171404 RepID=UPI001BE3EC34|nr:exopolysaccharide Pel transporter PelG [Paenibacillus agaridevorans]